jgi:S-adenosylmethionine:tRNA ribosyltransferase-isomerase|tara:strand:- start:2319 stop:3356 length:1038 start_codon:yes stop_codon:yes gene_type:complete
MKLSDFDYDLPPEAVASHPAEPRDAARLLDLRRDTLVDRIVSDLPDLLGQGDLMVVNNTRVIPARLEGRRGEAGISVTLHQRIAPDTWRCFAKPARKLRLGDQVEFSSILTAEVTALGEDGERTLTFTLAGDELDQAIEAHGSMPLPPYIPRPDGPTRDDSASYQTIYARHKGAVAAPTAGLHFTPELMQRIRDKGVNMAEVTLHVGAGTFLPVKTDDVRDHRMHHEWGEITAPVAEAINRTRDEGGRIIAVGTTTLRILEACWKENGCIQEWQAETDLFIIPGFRFGVIDLLMTNFHLPKSTLMMLVSAFAGKGAIDQAYAHALKTGYRFFSYGDACLMERRDD